MKIAVWDTYVKRADGKIMHFDILVDPEQTQDLKRVSTFGEQYLDTKPFETSALATGRCLLCHYEQATDKVYHDILTDGFSIVEFENCD